MYQSQVRNWIQQIFVLEISHVYNRIATNSYRNIERKRVRRRINYIILLFSSRVCVPINVPRLIYLWLTSKTTNNKQPSSNLHNLFHPNYFRIIVELYFPITNCFPLILMYYIHIHFQTIFYERKSIFANIGERGLDSRLNSRPTKPSFLFSRTHVEREGK